MRCVSCWLFHVFLCTSLHETSTLPTTVQPVVALAFLAYCAPRRRVGDGCRYERVRRFDVTSQPRERQEECHSYVVDAAAVGGRGHTTPMQQSPQSIKGAVASSLPTMSTTTSTMITIRTSTTAHPHLRRRRSSLTQATSPMSVVRSSGSLTLAGDAIGAGTYSNSRMRRGSCSDYTSSEAASKVQAPSFRCVFLS